MFDALTDVNGFAEDTSTIMSTPSRNSYGAWLGLPRVLPLDGTAKNSELHFGPIPARKRGMLLDDEILPF